MATKLLILGSATDGPTNSPLTFAKDQDIVSNFGGGYIERFTITPTATGVSLAYTPFSNPTNSLNYRLNYLFSPQVSGSTLTFGVPGGSGESILDLTYTPYTGQDDLVYAGRFALAQGMSPYLVRVGGQRASLTVGGWTFEAQYDGAKYNRLNVSWDGTTLTVSGMEPNYDPVVLVSEEGDLPEQIEYLYELGICPLYLQSSFGNLTPFSTTLSGGVDGCVDSNGITTFLNNCPIPNDTTHVLLLGELSSSIMTDIGCYLAEEQPIVFLIPAPAFTSPTSGWLTMTASSIPYRQPMVASVIGNGTSTVVGIQQTRYLAEAAAISFYREDPFSFTNLDLSVTDFDPVLSSQEIETLTNYGWICPVESIGKGPSLYQGVNTAVSNTLTMSCKMSEIVAVATGICLPYYGQTLKDGNQDDISASITSALTTVTYFTVQQVSVVTYSGSMVVSIVGLIPNEILSISFCVKNQ